MSAKKVLFDLTCDKRGCKHEARWQVQDDSGRPQGVYCTEHANERIKALDDYEAHLR